MHRRVKRWQSGGRDGESGVGARGSGLGNGNPGEMRWGVSQVSGSPEWKLALAIYLLCRPVIGNGKSSTYSAFHDHIRRWSMEIPAILL